MNDSTAHSQAEFVLRRLNESLQVGGREVNPYLWLAILVPILVLGLVYVVWQYKRDTRSIAWPWAVLLGGMRSVVYVILAGIFLLPAMQTWERSEKRARVLVLLDTSPSVAKTTDDLPEDGAQPAKPVTRLDKVVNFLTDKQANFFGRLIEKNPVHVYRFGARLDEEAAIFDQGQPAWDAAKWQSWLRHDFKPWVLSGLSDDGKEAVRRMPLFDAEKPGTAEWAIGWLKEPVADTVPAELSEADRAKFADNRAKLDKRIEAVRQLMLGTNVGESVLTLLNREANNPVRGVIVVSDGRSNLGSESAFEELRARARKERIPVFTVLVGEDRQPVSIRITDLQTPEQTPPDEKFVVRAEIDGEGLPDQDAKLSLDIYKPEDDKPTHTLETSVHFQPGEPPHSQAEFTIDPEQLPADLKSESSGRKELVEGEWKFVVRVPKDKRELFAGKEHVSDPAAVSVVKKPLRVLLVAGGPMKDYQFLRTLLVREKDAKRAELSIFLQNEGRDGRAVQDVEPERLLSRFPSTLKVEDDPMEKPEDRYYNLSRYDVIICFDPDWSDFTADQLLLLQKWVDQQAGGLILVAGPVNTYQLVRDDGSGRLKPLIDLFPVLPGDVVLQSGPLHRSTKQPWRLSFPGANPDMEFLKLDDESKTPLAGWTQFFDGTDKAPEGGPPKRGFFTVYPLKSVKPGAAVVATFGDPAAKLDGKDAPWLVTQQFGKGRVAFVGSSELYRLRGYKEVYFERFWTKLARYVAAGGRTRQNRRGVLVMGRQFTAGQYVRIEAQLFGPSLEPLAKTTKPKLVIQPSEGGERREVEMSAKPSQADWAGWFQGRFLAPKAGDYKLELPIPSSADVLRGKFSVKESNPELDNTRPDPAAMAAMAGDLDEIKGRLPEADFEALLARLRGKLTAPEKAEAKPVTSPG
ncbi:MAG TPA: vWA domain-containing protein, partial [Gemmataceae bacterium]|nr:vWA domain-containing protein [Gemmataceae bacterium]